MVIFPPGIGHQAVTGSACDFADEGVPAADNAGEERCFADVGSANDCDYWDCQFNTKLSLARGLDSSLSTSVPGKQKF